MRLFKKLIWRLGSRGADGGLSAATIVTHSGSVVVAHNGQVVTSGAS